MNKLIEKIDKISDIVEEELKSAQQAQITAGYVTHSPEWTALQAKIDLFDQLAELAGDAEYILDEELITVTRLDKVAQELKERLCTSAVPDKRDKFEAEASEALQEELKEWIYTE